jgi:hypothetical protein
MFVCSLRAIDFACRAFAETASAVECAEWISLRSTQFPNWAILPPQPWMGDIAEQMKVWHAMTLLDGATGVVQVVDASFLSRAR